MTHQVTNPKLETLRKFEVLYRSLGYFEEANQARMQADLAESGTAHDFLCSFIDRGIIEPIRCGYIDGLFGIVIPAGGVLLFTRSEQEQAFNALAFALEVKPSDCYRWAQQLMMAEASRCLVRLRETSTENT